MTDEPPDTETETYRNEEADEEMRGDLDMKTSDDGGLLTAPPGTRVRVEDVRTGVTETVYADVDGVLRNMDGESYSSGAYMVAEVVEGSL